ncbi:MAG: 4a-hydroxytetrahydrobiopterin dehydratase [Acidithiobacillus ferrooxidans]|uniref:4a-hydroxytetrahydrobiopterin dehydratase n=1 Tax=mine drainage metagenome TaxID=410659 RepID=E6QC14_9ZZZZ
MDQDLQHAHCVPCEGGVAPLDAEQVGLLLRSLPQWQVAGQAIRREFRFKNFYETMAFVNAVAWISHREDHHPDLELGYNRCVVHYSTHAIGGLSENDFICAARVDALLT